MKCIAKHFKSCQQEPERLVLEAGITANLPGRTLARKSSRELQVDAPCFQRLFVFLFVLFIFGCFGSSLLGAGFSLVVASSGYSLLWCTGFSLQRLLLSRSTGSRRVGFSSCGSRAIERRLSSCGARAQLLHSMWDLPRPGIEPVSPALAGGFLTTEPLGKSVKDLLNFKYPVLAFSTEMSLTLVWRRLSLKADSGNKMQLTEWNFHSPFFCPVFSSPPKCLQPPQPSAMLSRCCCLAKAF